MPLIFTSVAHVWSRVCLWWVVPSEDCPKIQVSWSVHTEGKTTGKGASPPSWFKAGQSQSPSPHWTIPFSLRWSFLPQILGEGNDLQLPVPRNQAGSVSQLDGYFGKQEESQPALAECCLCMIPALALPSFFFFFPYKIEVENFIFPDFKMLTLIQMKTEKQACDRQTKPVWDLTSCFPS